MTVTDHLIRGYSNKDSIDAIYYAVRYLQDPDRLPRNSQELFADGVHSLPSKQGVELTRKLLASIEARTGQSADQFGRPEVRAAVDELISAAAALDIDITPSEEAAAQRWVEQNRAGSVDAPATASQVYAEETVMGR